MLLLMVQKSQTATWHVWNLVNSGINHQPQLVSLPNFWTINSTTFGATETFRITGDPTRRVVSVVWHPNWVQVVGPTSLGV